MCLNQLSYGWRNPPGSTLPIYEASLRVDSIFWKHGLSTTGQFPVSAKNVPEKRRTILLAFRTGIFSGCSKKTGGVPKKTHQLPKISVWFGKFGVWLRFLRFFWLPIFTLQYFFRRKNLTKGRLSCIFFELCKTNRVNIVSRETEFV